MSELQIDKIKSISGTPVVLGPEILITDSSGFSEIFSASKTGGIRILGPLYAGTYQDNSPGNSGDILFGNGVTMPPVWKPLPVPSPEVIASNEIFPLMLTAFNGFATTTALPAAPTVNGVPAWIYCDGTNNTPDLRVVNPKSATGAKNWQLLADSDIRATIEITGATVDIRSLYNTLPLNKRVFYATTPAGVTWGAPTIGILRGITGPTTVGASGRPTGVPLHQKAVVIIGGGTAGDAANPGEFISGLPQDFQVGGYIKFKDITAGIMFTVNVVSANSVQAQMFSGGTSNIDWSNTAQYTKSLAFIKKI